MDPQGLVPHGSKSPCTTPQGQLPQNISSPPGCWTNQAVLSMSRMLRITYMLACLCEAFLNTRSTGWWHFFKHFKGIFTQIILEKMFSILTTVIFFKWVGEKPSPRKLPPPESWTVRRFTPEEWWDWKLIVSFWGKLAYFLGANLLLILGSVQVLLCKA